MVSASRASSTPRTRSWQREPSWLEPVATPSERDRHSIAAGSTDATEIIRGSGCLGCHKVGTEGGAIGPDLTHVGSRLSATLLRESILNPDAKIARGFEKFKGIMPKTFGEQLSAAQLESLVQFLASHK